MAKLFVISGPSGAGLRDIAAAVIDGFADLAHALHPGRVQRVLEEGGGEKRGRLLVL